MPSTVVQITAASASGSMSRGRSPASAATRISRRSRSCTADRNSASRASGRGTGRSGRSKGPAPRGTGRVCRRTPRTGSAVRYPGGGSDRRLRGDSELERGHDAARSVRRGLLPQCPAGATRWTQHARTAEVRRQGERLLHVPADAAGGRPGVGGRRHDAARDALLDVGAARRFRGVAPDEPGQEPQPAVADRHPALRQPGGRRGGDRRLRTRRLPRPAQQLPRQSSAYRPRQ